MLVSIILTGDALAYQNDSVWYGGNIYWINGKKTKIQVNKLNSLPPDELDEIRKTYYDCKESINYKVFDEYIERFISANKERYDYITEEAIHYVQEYREKYDIEDMMVSFSGGKDSTVTSHIVNKAFGTNRILHIFGDTTLEFPYTLEYKKRFNKNDESRGVRILTAKNREKNFEELCGIVGPPSRVMRWCCTVFKTGAIQKTITSAFKDKSNILSFQGIRHSESASRSKYERESESPKISKQTVVSPIIDWMDYDVSLDAVYKVIDKSKRLFDGYFDWIQDTIVDQVYEIWGGKKKLDLFHTLSEWHENQSGHSKMGLYEGRITNFMTCMLIR